MDRGDSVVYADMIRIDVGFKITFLSHLKFYADSAFFQLSLLTSTLIRDNVLNKDNLLDDQLLLICSSFGCDLNTYEELKQKVDTECIDGVNNGYNTYFLFNNLESQL